MLGLAGALFTTAVAHAHVAVTTGPAAANKTQDVTFSVGHGCEGGLDTYSLKIDIPAGVTGVRPLATDFGQATVETDASGNVTSVTWQKAEEDVLDADTSYYTFTMHLRTPDKPFTRMFFLAHQTCLAANGSPVTVDWIALPGQEGEPAPALVVVPAHAPGWNKYTVGEHITDPSVFFQDAQIVWRGTQAYSANPNTAALITSTPGVTALTDGLHPGDEIWVKY
jgi:uncharacterized protein YcnI